MCSISGKHGNRKDVPKVTKDTAMSRRVLTSEGTCISERGVVVHAKYHSCRITNEITSFMFFELDIVFYFIQASLRLYKGCLPVSLCN